MLCSTAFGRLGNERDDWALLAVTSATRGSPAPGCCCLGPRIATDVEFLSVPWEGPASGLHAVLAASANFCRDRCLRCGSEPYGCGCNLSRLLSCSLPRDKATDADFAEIAHLPDGGMLQPEFPMKLPPRQPQETGAERQQMKPLPLR
jgi:hypothetical protein